jgi:hypothetical protein
MTIQPINIGNVVNDGLGDDLRTAFEKVNANFTALDSELSITGLNIPENVNGESIFAGKSGLNLLFKKLVSGSNNLVLSSTADTVVISSSQPDAFTSITTDNNGVARASDSTGITLQGGSNITVTESNNVITVDTDLDLNQILKTVDFGPISDGWESTVQLNTAAANIDFGTITNPGRINIDFGTVVSPS